MQICRDALIETGSSNFTQETEVYCRGNPNVPCPVVYGDECLKNYLVKIMSVSGESVDVFPEAVIKHEMMVPVLPP